MSDERWIVIPRWDRFQHYRDRNPLWVKAYVELLHDEAYLDLTLAERGLLHGLWLEYAASHGRLRGDTANLTRRLGQRARESQLDRLNRAGFIEFSASRPLALTRSREGEGEEEPSPTPPADAGGDQAKPPKRRIPARKLRQFTGCRYARGTHGSTYVHDPLGTAKPPADWPHPKPDEAAIVAALEERGEDASG